MPGSLPPPPDRDVWGVAELGQTRLRRGLFGLKLEVLCERADGVRFWRRASIGTTFLLRSNTDENLYA